MNTRQLGEAAELLVYDRYRGSTRLNPIHFRGSIRLDERCDFTDPSTKKDDWGRYTITNMQPGMYNCYAVINDRHQVTGSWIIHEDYDNSRFIDLQVDANKQSVVVAGTFFGYFSEKPDSFKTENNVINIVNSDDGHDAFYTRAGKGDCCGYLPYLWVDAKTRKTVGARTLFI